MMTFAKYSFISFLLAAGCGGGSGTKNDAGTLDNSWLPLKVGYFWEYQIRGATGTVSAKIQSVAAEETVGGDGDAKSMTAFKLITGNRINDPEGDVSYQALVDETRYVRFRELSIAGSTGALKKEEYYATPWKLRLDVSDAHMAAGASWPESYTQFEVDTPAIPATDGGAAPVADAGSVTDAGTPPGDGGLVTTRTQTTDVWMVVAVDQTVTVPAGTFKALVVRRQANSGLGSDKTFWFVRGIGKVKETGIGEQTEELRAFGGR